MPEGTVTHNITLTTEDNGTTTAVTTATNASGNTIRSLTISNITGNVALRVVNSPGPKLGTGNVEVRATVGKTKTMSNGAVITGIGSSNDTITFSSGNSASGIGTNTITLKDAQGVEIGTVTDIGTGNANFTPASK